MAAARTRLAARTPGVGEWVGLAVTAYGVSRFNVAAGVVCAGLFVLAESVAAGVKGR